MVFYSIACSLMARPIFDMWYTEGCNASQVREQFYILSLYGVGRGAVPFTRYVECYDGECRTSCQDGKGHATRRVIRRDKYANFKT